MFYVIDVNILCILAHIISLQFYFHHFTLWVSGNPHKISTFLRQTHTHTPLFLQGQGGINYWCLTVWDGAGRWRGSRGRGIRSKSFRGPALMSQCLLFSSRRTWIFLGHALYSIKLSCTQKETSTTSIVFIIASANNDTSPPVLSQMFQTTATS